MNGYKAFFKGKQIEIYSDSLYHAKVEACKQLKVPNRLEHMVSVVLCELAGKPVIHVADF